MKQISHLIILCVCMVLGACDQTSPDIQTDNSVGLIRKNFKDKVRTSWDGSQPRPLTTYIWYPATAEAHMSMVGIPPEKPIFLGGYAAKDAEFVSGNVTYPLIVMSHGTGGAGLQMMWLGRELAMRGYIVAAVDHHGNTAAEDKFDARGFRLPWERARDLSAIIDHLLVDPKFAAKIDSDRIGVVGFSLGGYTVTALAGGITDFGLLGEFCTSEHKDTTCDDQSEFPEASVEFEKLKKIDPRVQSSLAQSGTSFRDERIRAAVALAPALGQIFTEKSLKDIRIPFLLVAGSADTIAPMKTNAYRLDNNIPNAQLYIIDGAGHYVFLNTCNEQGKVYIPICKDAEGVIRSQVHTEAIEQVSTFFQNNLGQ